MIGHYLLTALAKFRRAPFTTLANVLTLALGLLAIITAWGVVSHWRNSDRDLVPPSRAIVLTSAYNGNVITTPTDRTPVHVAKYVREDIPSLESVARFFPMGEVATDTGERIVVLKGALAEPALLDIFRFRFIAGNPATALNSDSTVILTQSAAERLFGNEPAIGRSLVLARESNVTVTGVIAPIEQPSIFTGARLEFDYLTVMPPDPVGQPENWGMMAVTTFGLLPADGSLTLAEVDRQLAAMAERRTPADDKDEGAVFRAAPVQEITELGLNRALFGSNAKFSVVPVLFGLGLLVLGVACLNYANLATAQATARTKEVGMRKVLGASRLGVLVQSWVEAGISTLAALALTGLFLSVAAPVLKAQTNIDIGETLLRDPVALAAIAGVSVAAALVAGLYPAFVIARVRPAEALGAGKVRGGPRVISEILVGVQFAAASALLIAVFVVNQQNDYLRSLALKPSADPVVTLPPTLLTGVSVETLRQQLAAYPQVKAVGEVVFLPWSPGYQSSSLTRTPGTSGSRVTGSILGVGYGYFDAADLTVLAGRVFDEQRDEGAVSMVPDGPAPSPERSESPLVIDRLYAEQLGFASPGAAVGQRVYYGREMRTFEIVGVVENQPRMLQGQAGLGSVYTYAANRPTNRPIIRISATDVDGGVAAINRAWREVAPNMPLDYKFLDQVFEQNFRSFDRVGRLFSVISALAFLISAIGLFGMAVHVIQRRVHEIGVRKTLGSSASRVAGLLLTDFSKPVVVANLLAWPLAWYAAQTYLNPFVNRIEVGVLPFVVSMAITLGIAWLAVGGQTLRAANLRPADVLRRS